ncbi:MAG: metallophosphoesterase, partial [Promethearchaeota archaeon]
MIWFTADFHLSHKNIIKYSNRPFKTVEEMDEIIINNLEERIKPQDILYFLGDLTFKEIKAREFFQRFEEIEIHYIIGNHDSSEVIKIIKENS